jgi:hypothetical protein
VGGVGARVDGWLIVVNSRLRRCRPANLSSTNNPATGQLFVTHPPRLPPPCRQVVASALVLQEVVRSREAVAYEAPPGTLGAGEARRRAQTLPPLCPSSLPSSADTPALSPPSSPPPSPASLTRPTPPAPAPPPRHPLGRRPLALPLRRPPLRAQGGRPRAGGAVAHRGVERGDDHNGAAARPVAVQPRDPVRPAWTGGGGSGMHFLPWRVSEKKVLCVSLSCLNHAAHPPTPLLPATRQARHPPRAGRPAADHHPAGLHLRLHLLCALQDQRL